MAYERLTAYTNAGDFLAADVNNDFDRLWLALQQNGGDLDGRVLIAPNTDPTSINMTIPAKTARLGKYLKFNDTTGNPEAGSIAGAFTAAGMNVYNFTGDGTTVNFTLGMEPGGENNTQVYIDGVYQQKNTYNVSGAVVQFSAAPPNLSTIEVMVVQVLPVGATTASQVSFTQAGSTYGRNVQLKLQESVSVKDFGAVGDGVTDDTAAINAAFSAAAANKVPVTASNGTFRCTSSIILKSNLNYIGNHSALFVQDYNYVVSAKNESLFVNESYDNNASLDTNISLYGLNITNSGTTIKGSFISINRCEGYEIKNLKAVKSSANGTLNINGKNVFLDSIEIDSLPASVAGVNADGIHFEYLENAVLSNLNIQSQDDCLGFAYFPIIPGNPNNGPAGRDTPSANIVVTNCVLKCDIATGIRVGNTTAIGGAAGLALDNQISPNARYENMTFSNIVFNKAGVSGPCIIMNEIRDNMAYPNNNIRFNNCVINDSTSTTTSLIEMKGNAYITGQATYGASGSIRNYNRVFFNGISGTHNTAGQTINAGGVSYLSLSNYEIQRISSTADNEIITRLVDNFYLKDSVVTSNPLSGTSNTVLCIDYDNIRIEGTDLLGGGGENAAIELWQVNKPAASGSLVMSGCVMSGQVTGIKPVGAYTLNKLQIEAETSGLTGTLTTANLNAVAGGSGFEDQMGSLNASISGTSLNLVRKSGNIGILNIIFTTSATISAGATLAVFPAIMAPSNGNAVRAFISDNSGTQYQVDYSSGANLRSQSSIPAGDYYLTLSYPTGL
jgi:hypothetical protein